jgi:hypothetical protein
VTPQEEWRLRALAYREGLPQPILAKPEPKQIGTPVPPRVKRFGWYLLVAAVCAIVLSASVVLYNDATKAEFSNGFRGDKPLSQHNRHHVRPE